MRNTEAEAFFLMDFVPNRERGAIVPSLEELNFLIQITKKV